MSDFCETKELTVFVQENGIIRDTPTGRIIARLGALVKYESLVESPQPQKGRYVLVEDIENPTRDMIEAGDIAEAKPAYACAYQDSRNVYKPMADILISNHSHPPPDQPEVESQWVHSEEDMVVRREDMSPTGKLTLFRQVDGDIVVQVTNGSTKDDFKQAAVEYCLSRGASINTLRALGHLMVAMEKDNKEMPIPTPPLDKEQG